MAATPDAVSDDPGPATLAREHVLSADREVVTGVLDAADDVAGDWPSLPDGRPATSDREAVVDPLRRELEERDLLGRLPGLLAGAVKAAGYRLPADPVPAPPYVAVTSTGPVLRGTVDDGRLVVAVDCFEVVRARSLEAERNDCSEAVRDGARVVYARSGTSPEAALSVRFRRDSE